MKSLRHSGWCIVLIALVASISGIWEPLRDISPARNALANATGMDTLVSAEWLDEHLEDPDLVDPSSRYPYAIPAPEKFASAMAALGVSDNSRFVVYSRDYSAWAARVWWMLRWIGFENAAVLDGGLDEWAADPANPLEVN